MLTVGPFQIQALQLKLFLPKCCLAIHGKSIRKMKDLENDMKRRAFLDQPLQSLSVIRRYIM